MVCVDHGRPAGKGGMADGVAHFTDDTKELRYEQSSKNALVRIQWPEYVKFRCHELGPWIKWRGMVLA